MFGNSEQLLGMVNATRSSWFSSLFRFDLDRSAVSEVVRAVHEALLQDTVTGAHRKREEARGKEREINRLALLHGDSVEVISPETLREEFAEIAREMRRLYRKQTTSRFARLTWTVFSSGLVRNAGQ